MREIYICLPVHNEEKYLEKCLISIVSSVKLIPDCQIKIFICLNDCHDGSEDVANMCKQKYFKLNIEVLRSKKGKLNAQEKMLSEIPSSKIVFFIISTIVVMLLFLMLFKEKSRICALSYSLIILFIVLIFYLIFMILNLFLLVVF